MSLPQVVSRNGRFMAPTDAHISIFNPVIFGAFGVYESIQLYAGVIYLLEDHLQRLAASAAAIDLALPGDQSLIARWTREVVAANECRDALIRIFALGATADNGPEIFIWPEAPRAFPAALYEQGAGAVTYSGERALPQAKSLNTLVNHMAKARALATNEHEGVLVNRDGNVTEGSSSNLFVVRDGALLTAPEEDVLAGVTQIEVLALAEQLSIPVLREKLPLSDRYRWDEAFLTSTSRHVLPLVRLDGQPIGSGAPGPVTQRLRDAFEERFLKVVHAAEQRLTF